MVGQKKEVIEHRDDEEIEQWEKVIHDVADLSFDDLQEMQRMFCDGLPSLEDTEAFLDTKKGS